MTHKEVEEYLLAKPGAWLDYPFGEGVAVYKVGSKETAKMFALVKEASQPLQISLKCDPILAEKLREQYESVVPGYHLHKKYWNTIVASGQLTNQEIFDLINLSHQLVVEGFQKLNKQS